MTTVKCVFCASDLDPRSSIALRRVFGWERKAGPARRGGSDILLREPGDEWACQFCVEKQKRNVSPHQEGLL